MFFYATNNFVINENEKEKLPYQFIQDTILGLEELKSGQIEPYIFESEENAK
jgi:hypothetical protein